jgi:hypothetical protein
MFLENLSSEHVILKFYYKIVIYILLRQKAQ